MSVIEFIKHSEKSYQKGTKCDAYLQVNGHLFPINRSVLAASSFFFEKLFDNNWKESQQLNIVIDNIEPCIMKKIIKWTYTWEISINIENAVSLWIAADYFQLCNIRDLCTEILIKHIKKYIRIRKHIPTDPILGSILEIRLYANLMDYTGLVVACDNYIGCNLTEIMKSKEFLQLNFNQLICLIESDDLIAETEESIFKACEQWIQFEKNENRTLLMPKVFAKVRWQLLSSDFLEKEKWLMETSQECENLMNSTIELDKYWNLFENSRPRNDVGDVGKIFVLGGCEIDGIMEIYDPKTKEWYRKELSEQICVMNMVAMKDKLYFLKCIGEFVIYDTKSNEWSRSERVQTLNKFPAVTALNHCIYLCGGNEMFASLTTVQCFDSIENTWKSVPSMTQCRFKAAAVTHDDLIYVIGGCDENNSVLKTVECFDPVRKCWKQVASLKHKRHSPAAVSFKGKIYVCGGNNGKSILKSVEMYDPIQDKWKKIASMNLKRESPALVSNLGKIWAIGGMCECIVESYNPETNRWTFEVPMIKSRVFPLAVVIP